MSSASSGATNPPLKCWLGNADLPSLSIYSFTLNKRHQLLCHADRRCTLTCGLIFRWGAAWECSILLLRKSHQLAWFVTTPIRFISAIGTLTTYISALTVVSTSPTRCPLPTFCRICTTTTTPIRCTRRRPGERWRG